MEDIDGGLHPAVDGQSLGERWNRKATDRGQWKALMEGYILQWTDKAWVKGDGWKWTCYKSESGTDDSDRTPAMYSLRQQNSSGSAACPHRTQTEWMDTETDRHSKTSHLVYSQREKSRHHIWSTVRGKKADITSGLQSEGKNGQRDGQTQQTSHLVYSQSEWMGTQTSQLVYSQRE